MATINPVSVGLKAEESGCMTIFWQPLDSRMLIEITWLTCLVIMYLSL